MRQKIVRLATLPFESFDFGALRRRREPLARLCQLFLDGKGEAAAMVIGQEIIERFESAEPEEQRAFFEFLLDEYGYRFESIDAAIEDYLASPGQAVARKLASSLKTTRRSFFQALNAVPGGTRAIVNMRATLARFFADDPELELVDKDIAILLENWFNRGFLELREINWETPAFILEKLIAYEAVHEIDGWNDLRRRLAHDRRCFAFFHPAMPDEPLIFVEVALLNEMASSVQALLGQSVPEETDDFQPSTAIFYSISNCQAGLRGITFGNFLIKQVVEELGASMPHIKQYATLSPVPGFYKWLQRALAKREVSWLEEQDYETINSLLSQGDWHEHEPTCATLEPLLKKLASYYFLHVKHARSYKPFDPVARFHLGNGARLERINFLGDTSEKGLKESCGLLVNYLYEEKSLASNHEAYANNDEIKCSNDVLQPIKKFTA